MGTDRPAAAIAARKQTSLECRARLADAIVALAATNHLVTPASVARQAKVARQTLYRHRDLLDEIDVYRKRQMGVPKTRRQVGEAEMSETKSLRAQLRHSQVEVQDLRRQLRSLEAGTVQALGDAAKLAINDDFDSLRRENVRLSDVLASQNEEIEHHVDRIESLEGSLIASREESRRLNGIATTRAVRHLRIADAPSSGGPLSG